MLCPQKCLMRQMPGGGGNGGVGDASPMGKFPAVGVFGVNLDKLFPLPAQFDAYGPKGSGDSLFFPSERAAFDPFQAEAEGGGFTENQRGKVFGILGQGENGEELAGPALFHDQGGSSGIKSTLGHQALDGVGQVLAGDVIEVGSDFHHLVMGGSAVAGGVPQKGPQDIGTLGQFAGAKPVTDAVGHHRIDGAEVVDGLGQNGRPGRGGEFGGNLDLAEGDSAEDLGGRGSREREVAVGAMDGAGALDRD